MCLNKWILMIHYSRLDLHPRLTPTGGSKEGHGAGSPGNRPAHLLNPDWVAKQKNRNQTHTPTFRPGLARWLPHQRCGARDQGGCSLWEGYLYRQRFHRSRECGREYDRQVGWNRLVAPRLRGRPINFSEKKRGISNKIDGRLVSVSRKPTPYNS
jgi:hypothetical protein